MNTNINYERAAEIAGNLTSEANKMQTTFETMKSHFDQINSGRGTFDGTAASEVRSKFDSFSNNFSLFYNAVNSYASYISQAAANYQAVDSAAQKAVSGLDSIR